MLRVDTGRSFWQNSTGRWAGEQLLRAMKEGGIKAFGPQALRTLDTLQKDEWKYFDDQIIEEGKIRLNGIADLIREGLTLTIPNGMAKTVLEYEATTDMEDAYVSMDAMSDSDNDRIEYELGSLPLPITHKDFFLHIRQLLASRERGESLDATQARIAARKVTEMGEQMLFQGGRTFQGKTIYGYTTHPNRNTVGFGSNGNWAQSAKTGDNILTDTQSLIALNEGDRFYGPYGMYVDSLAVNKLASDYKANGDLTIAERLLKDPRIKFIHMSDKMPANTVVLVQLTSDVVRVVEGMPLQTVQWDVHGGMRINFKVMQILVPNIRMDSQDRSGVAHMS